MCWKRGSEGLNGLNSFADNKIGWFKGKLGELGDLLLFFQKTIILQIKFFMSTVSRTRRTRNRLTRGRKRWNRRRIRRKAYKEEKENARVRLVPCASDNNSREFCHCSWEHLLYVKTHAFASGNYHLSVDNVAHWCPCTVALWRSIPATLSFW